MPDSSIQCPKCGHSFALTEAVTQQIEAALSAKYERERQQLREKAAEHLRAKEAEYVERLKQEKAKLELAAREQAGIEMAEMRERLLEQDRRLTEARERELAILKEKRELLDRQQELELEVERKLSAARDEIWGNAKLKSDEEHRLKDIEKEKMLTDMRLQIEELKRKAEQGSQQLQGEALEWEVETMLRVKFPQDDIEPVAKGTRGADLVQKVAIIGGHACILWEIKNTKNWQDGWIGKLKDDQRARKADVAVIISRELPAGVSRCTVREGVWITDFETALGLATTLRCHIIELAKARAAGIGKHHKMEMVYDYVTGREFAQRVSAIAEAFVEIKKDLDAERRALEKQWSKREKQLQKAITACVGMYGDFQGVFGAVLPEIEILQLPSADGNGTPPDTLELTP